MCENVDSKKTFGNFKHMKKDYEKWDEKDYRNLLEAITPAWDKGWTCAFCWP